ncbi:transcriptional regulator [Halalkalibacter hemicellulosilyticusJCM 9152]|uniref:Transcriptional regulator n=1 Tax=Halalkalibacter hemicellulosilyticusJCM 9152 TaxID=1236971 RepID=W4QHH2_9BACI|nr:transcriptional regulator [Halalkalibacter hemicellulosilyticusJCM 9152]
MGVSINPGHHALIRILRSANSKARERVTFTTPAFAAFKRYTAYGFYGLLTNWINTGFEISQEELIKEVITITTLIKSTFFNRS